MVWRLEFTNRHSGESRNPVSFVFDRWIPAFAGMTSKRETMVVVVRGDPPHDESKQ
jgi:hypothetical protein